MDVSQLISGIGIGALITTLVQSFISYKTDISKRNFIEKKECYVGLLEAYHQAELHNTVETGKTFGYWQLRCDLVAPENIRKAIQEVIDNRQNQRDRYAALSRLRDLLREDMDVTRK